MRVPTECGGNEGIVEIVTCPFGGNNLVQQSVDIGQRELTTEGDLMRYDGVEYSGKLESATDAVGGDSE